MTATTAKRFHAALVCKARPSNRDNSVMLPDGCMYHDGCQFALIVGNERVILCDDSQEPFTLRRFAPHRPTAHSNYLTLDDNRICLSGLMLWKGIWLEYTTELNLGDWTAEVCF